MIIARENAALLKPADARRISVGAQVLAQDPGKRGAVAMRLGSKRLLFRDLMSWESCAGMVAWSEPLVLLQEEQFQGVNPQSVKETTYGAGAFMGFLFAHGAPSFTVVHVAPATWQSAQQRRVRGKVGRQLSRDEGIELAVGELMAVDPMAAASVNAAQREGYASALGILLWWEGLCRSDRGIHERR